VDSALSPQVAAGLRKAGHDAIHTRDYDIETAPDIQIFARAAVEGRTILSADTDFGTLLALREESKPSVILLRRGPKRPDMQIQLLLANLPALEEFATQGSIIVIEDARIRVRRLPIGIRE